MISRSIEFLEGRYNVETDYLDHGSVDTCGPSEMSLPMVSCAANSKFASANELIDSLIFKVLVRTVKRWLVVLYSCTAKQVGKRMFCR